jgi:hypothetical protein
MTDVSYLATTAFDDESLIMLWDAKLLFREAEWSRRVNRAELET